MTIRTRLFVLTATAFSLVAVVGHADATFPGSNGLLAFNRSSYIYVINPDGTGERSLTRGARPDWSPDGTKIAFVRGSNDDGSLSSSIDPGDIYIVNAKDGTGLKRLTYSDNGSGSGLWTHPNWSPDGTKIAATYGGHACNGVNNDVRIINAADGSLVSHFTASAVCETFPAWSPDGTKIAYLQYQSAGFCGIVVAQLNYDGDEGKRYLPNSCAESGPIDWSPDGGSLVYAKYRGGPGGISVQTADGTGPPSLLRAGGNDPKWSPDGTRIVFRTTKVGEAHSLYTMPARRVHGQSDVFVATQGYSPDWGPSCSLVTGRCFTHG